MKMGKLHQACFFISNHQACFQTDTIFFEHKIKKQCKQQGLTSSNDWENGEKYPQKEMSGFSPFLVSSPRMKISSFFFLGNLWS